MANAQVGGIQLLADAAADTTARAGGLHLLVDAAADTVARVGGIMLLVDAHQSTGLPFVLLQSADFRFQRATAGRF